jgi:hypothetical protein
MVATMLTLDDADWLRELADQLTWAPRFGAAEDEPEGVKFIQLSDTLATDISERLRLIATPEHLNATADISERTERTARR